MNESEQKVWMPTLCYRCSYTAGRAVGVEWCLGRVTSGGRQPQTKLVQLLLRLRIDPGPNFGFVLKRIQIRQVATH